ncbi:MAG: hypothetical protein COV43_09000 [Deltaproteobacteria bacterium CG11_big_fil_rev_8_21_14_0_20_42_23]|nr:MAG: hypothetical protein COV43_09000 [Deltaproteobacteria bacterium CG11_big_fil_rev_8_21_14_0_20_42_23]PJC63415.1 MAG: hypothetical protein CO021_09610 [Deltaproteobacteria bacterium CG_4_9_14_0_2_um_filter_42_21]
MGSAFFVCFFSGVGHSWDTIRLISPSIFTPCKSEKSKLALFEDSFSQTSLGGYSFCKTPSKVVGKPFIGKGKPSKN